MVFLSAARSKLGGLLHSLIDKSKSEIAEERFGLSYVKFLKCALKSSRFLLLSMGMSGSWLSLSSK